MIAYRLKVKPSGPGKKYRSYDLGVPTEIGAALVQAGIEGFTVELTKDGILYRPMSQQPPTSLPAWLERKETR